MKIGHHREVLANYYVAIGSNSNEKVKTFKYLGLSSQFPSKNLRNKIYKTIT